MEALNQKQKMVTIIVIAVVVCVIGYYYINSTKEVYEGKSASIDSETEIQEEEEDTDEEKKTLEEETILVHISGAVKSQGVVEVKETARINDVIEEAGGTTEDADLSKVNLAYKVTDGQKINIPSKDKKYENTEVISNDAGEGVVVEGDTTSNANGKVNINTATSEILETLPGIGVSTALKIVTYRITNGKFKTIEDLKNVSGVGEAKYEAIKDLICI